MISRQFTRIQPLMKKTQLCGLRFQSSAPPGPKPGAISTKEKSYMIYSGAGGALAGIMGYKMYRDQHDKYGQYPKLDSR